MTERRIQPVKNQQKTIKDQSNVQNYFQNMYCNQFEDNDSESQIFIRNMSELGLQTISQRSQLMNMEESFSRQNESLGNGKEGRTVAQLTVLGKFEKMRQKIERMKESQQILVKFIKKQKTCYQKQVEDVHNQISATIQQFKKRLIKKFKQQKLYFSQNIIVSQEKIQKQEQEIIDLKKTIKYLENELKNQDKKIHDFNAKITKTEREKSQLLKQKIQFSIQNQILQSRLHEQLQLKNERQLVFNEVSMERDRLDEEKKKLKNKIDEIEGEIDKRFEEQVGKIKREIHIIQNNFYMKEMQKINDSITQLKDKYRQKKQELEERQSYFVIRQKQIERKNKKMDEEKIQIFRKEMELKKWEQQLKQGSQISLKQRKSLFNFTNELLVESKFMKPEKETLKNESMFLACREPFQKNMSNSFSYRASDRKAKKFKKVGEKTIKYKQMETSIGSLDGQVQVLKTKMKGQIEELKKKLSK